MKKILMFAIIAVFIMMPLASFAKSAISDKDLDAVTAETGVSIVFDNVKINSAALTSLSWGDSDGYTGATGPGYVGINGVAIAGSLVEMSGTMNVDVGNDGSSTRVKIDLPTISLGGSAGMNITANLKLSGNSDLSSGATLGNIDIRGFKTSVIGTVTVFAH